VEIQNPLKLTETEISAITRRVRRANLALYSIPCDSEGDSGNTPLPLLKDKIRALTANFGLERMDANLCADGDGITPLSVDGSGDRGTYIPYTNRPLSWHTDGYYNPPDRMIRGMVLHCVCPAASGGDNDLMDPEIVYIRLRDQDPAHIRALSHAEAMTIPANEEGEGGAEIRGEQTGSVFSVAADGSLHMRYSARKRNIRWRDDPETASAVTALEKILADAGPYRFHHRMEAGQGLVCNNVLHRRDGFEDDENAKRLVFRARYYDRVRETAPVFEGQ